MSEHESPVSSGVISDAAQISVGWLDTVLRRSGAITHGHLTHLKTLPSASTYATLVRIRAAYSGDAEGELPRELILKMCQSGHGFIEDSEVNYYTRDYRQFSNAPLPPCYDAKYCQQDGSYHVLLKDLSATHRTDVSPSLDYARSLASAAATLHLMGRNIPIRETPEQSIERYFSHVSQGCEPLLCAAAPELNESELSKIRLVFERGFGVMIQRARQSGGFELLHGDLNPGNILYPRDPAGNVFFIDRQPFAWSLTHWLGVSELAYAIVQYWEPRFRQLYESEVLNTYHHVLSVGGNDGYTAAQLLSDYKLCALQIFFNAAEWCIKPTERASMKWLWMSHLRRALAAYDDLELAETTKLTG